MSLDSFFFFFLNDNVILESRWEAEWNKQVWGKRNTQEELLENIKINITLRPELKSQRDTERNEQKLGQWSFQCCCNCLQCLCWVNLFGKQRGKQKGNEINRKKQRKAWNNNKQLLTEVNGEAAGGGAAAWTHLSQQPSSTEMIERPGFLYWRWSADDTQVQEVHGEAHTASEEHLRKLWRARPSQNTPTNSFFARCQAKTGSGATAAVEESRTRVAAP